MASGQSKGELIGSERTMITPAYAQMMARYNRWQNRSLYTAADQLTDAQRWQDRGAYFGSIHGTLSHLIFGDKAWMFRFTRDEALKPEVTSIADSLTAFPDWTHLQATRAALDAQIIAWTDRLTTADLAGDLTYHAVSSGRDFTGQRWRLVTHMFNHQTHHRGQVHALLTQAGTKPDDTDIPLMPPDA
jgi:uncharacterized damage-inducible protein DinB